MTTDERNYFESLESLRKAAYVSYNDRRSYEWKLALSIWSSLGLVIAGLVQPIENGKIFLLKGTIAWIVALALGVVLIAVHIMFSIVIAKANEIDRGVSLIYMECMQKSVAVQFGDKLTGIINKYSSNNVWWKQSHIAQIFITIILVTAVAVIIFFRSA